LAVRFVKKCKAKFDLDSMIADLDNFDYDDLKTLQTDQIAVFVLATCGEGTATDNAIGFEHFLSQSKPFQLKYAVFGLGSSSYRFYNAMIQGTDTSLQALGATWIGQLGLGDDGKGTLEEDFSEWKDDTLTAIADHFHLPKIEYQFVTDFEIKESGSTVNSGLFLGEPNRAQLRNKVRGPFSSVNPLPAHILEAKEVFNSAQRNYVHLEFDISGTSIVYETGDHLAVWPVNSDLEVNRFLRAFGLYDKRHTIIEISSKDTAVKAPIPSLTTYESAIRYYLDIAAPVSRQFLEILAGLITDEHVRQQIANLASDTVQLFTQNKSFIASKILHKSSSWLLKIGNWMRYHSRFSWNRYHQ